MIVALLVSALLSQRLGAVTKRPRSYRWFFVAVALIMIGMMIRLLQLGAAQTGDMALLYTVLLAVALTLSVVIAWRYWGWLLSERRGEHAARDSHEGTIP